MNETERDERIERLEVKLAYMEDFLLKLQDEVTKRSAQIDRLTNAQDAVVEKLKHLSSELEEIPNQRPPHY